MTTYAANGSWNISVVTASTTGIYAADGSLNVVLADSTTVGAYHPTGAIWVTVVPDNTITSLRAPDGSLYVYEGAYTGCGQQVTVVAGSLTPGGGGALVPVIIF